jgi:hypothetical protein
MVISQVGYLKRDSWPSNIFAIYFSHLSLQQHRKPNCFEYSYVMAVNAILHPFI